MIELNKIYLGDCLEVMKDIEDKSIDLVLTDPPYPDYHTEKYKYQKGMINPLNNLTCKQLIFWSAKEPFPLNHTAIHIWDKKCGVGSMYERIFERNGGLNFRVYNYYLINSTVAASYAKDVFTGHPSQKPKQLIKELILQNSNIGDTILDCFSGSGTTAIACLELNRNFICIEKDPMYHELSVKRVNNYKSQMKMKFAEAV